MSFLCFGVLVVEAAQRPEDHTARSADLYQSGCALNAAGGICKPDVLSVSMLERGCGKAGLRIYRLTGLLL